MKAIIEIEVNRHFGQVYIKFPEAGHCCDSTLEPFELKSKDATLAALHEIISEYIDTDIKNELEEDD